MRPSGPSSSSRGEGPLAGGRGRWGRSPSLSLLGVCGVSRVQGDAGGNRDANGIRLDSVLRASGAAIQLFGFILLSVHFLVENSAVTKYL